MQKSIHRTALIIHGTCDREEYFNDEYPSLSNSHWLPWLQKQLLMAGFETQTPEMPDAYWPNYDRWKDQLQRYTIGAQSVLIGHSCGAGFLLRWLSEHHIPVARLILVAPWIDPAGRKDPSFFNFTIDRAVSSRAEIHLLESDDDSHDVKESVVKIRAALPTLQYHPFHAYGHFCFSDMGTISFPELRNIALDGKPNLS